MAPSPDVLTFSRYLARLVGVRPELAPDTGCRPAGPAELRAWGAAEAPTEEALKPVLRRLKQRAYARIARRDLAGQATLAEITEGMSAIAEVAIEAALKVCNDALRDFFQPVHSLTGGAGEPDRIHFMLLVVALAGDAIGRTGTGGKAVVFDPQMGRTLSAASAEEEDSHGKNQKPLEKGPFITSFPPFGKSFIYP